MHLAVMSSAQGDSKFVTDLAAKRRRLRKAQVMGVGRAATANETRLLGDGFDMLPIAESTRCC